MRTSANALPPSIFTVDVEDWFHIMDLPTTPPPAQWDSLAGRVQVGTRKLLDLLDEHDVKGTFFVLGWVAQNHSALVREIRDRGHEIGCHSFNHQLLTTRSPKETRVDIRAAKSAIEDATGHQVVGYRAPGFSVTEQNLWIFELLVEEGFRFDSSIFPGKHGHGGLPKAPLVPFTIETKAGLLYEFPVTQASFASLRIAFSGGGYLRLLPQIAISLLTQSVRSAGRPTIFYIHPRELDPEHPRLAMPIIRQFKSYVNLRSTPSKIARALSIGQFVRMGDYSLDTRLVLLPQALGA